MSPTAADPWPFSGAKILLVGATGQVGFPLARALARDHEVWGAARFSDPRLRDELEAAGVHCITVDLERLDLDDVPDDVTYVLNFAVLKSNDWDRDLDANVGGVGTLMQHCRGAEAFLHCSTTAVYRAIPDRAYAESDPLGDNHGVWANRATYSISKIAAEAMARFGAHTWGLRTTIARLNVPYGPNGGLPTRHLDAIVAGEPIELHSWTPNLFNPIHIDDIVATVPRLLAAASTRPTTVNWGGSEAVGAEEWCAHLGRLVGRTPVIRTRDDTIMGVPIDVTRMHELIGRMPVPWQQRMNELAVALYPDLVAASDEAGSGER